MSVKWTLSGANKTACYYSCELSKMFEKHPEYNDNIIVDMPQSGLSTGFRVYFEDKFNRFDGIWITYIQPDIHEIYLIGYDNKRYFNETLGYVNSRKFNNLKDVYTEILRLVLIDK
jgi:hypothetical protein